MNVDVQQGRDEVATALREDVRAGLSARPKWLPSKWLYDARGSELFDRITELAEYYPTRAEREILHARAPEIASMTGAGTLVELGSGSSEKTRSLLDALSAHGTLRTCVPLDVSEVALTRAAYALATDYPALSVRGVVRDFTQRLGVLPGERPQLVAFLGGTIGNFLPSERVRFLRSIREALHPGEWLLLGTDLVKDPRTLVCAYDDSAGVTAEFNRNVLQVLNRQLGATFDPNQFEHVAHWDAHQEWIEMLLRSRSDQVVCVPGADLEVPFQAGEDIRTEISAKFRPDGVAAELGEAGFTLERWWTDSAQRFGISLARSVP